MLNSGKSQLSKKERLEARLTSEQKELLQIAAEMEGTTLTDFVIRSAQYHARRVISEHNQIKLSLEDSQSFVESLLNPPAPNERMMKAAAEYKKAIGLK